MKTPRSHRYRTLLLVPLLAAGLAGPTTAQAATTGTAPTGSVAAAPAAAPVAAPVAAIPPICESALPPEAGDTVALIDKGGPYPYPQDGTVFQNREGLLPDEPQGFYHEYTVKTPGSSNRGARRIITSGDQGHDGMYWTSDHYAHFSDINFTC
ncbi:ribonuclease domain-containing protein [Spirillospora sp. NBC_01491]|uniref:ribonuclease domain-containing protein n=1 Tax=Spirillospora sp. NBC_01491 TaxID=2976007 RepID=UPI002E337422|nr:ribonuclease domain-containing protein [Spirillospora sp. NBC_01491]